MNKLYNFVSRCLFSHTLACIAVAHAWLGARPSCPCSTGVQRPLPMVFFCSNLCSQRRKRFCVQCLLSRTLQLRIQCHDRRFNDFALGYRGVVGLNAPLVGLGGIQGFRK
ncbi:hypothetical protein CEXT_413551 [Caerostris extrusa]|uniref:Secreted protein n=1 Tax=Caerostris extrusa TaxID=172846 RepID=A0AAV4VAI4_CAEEX|nr:hypothetical protein CEXT_413551 [Caerostris extrusa]